MTIKSTLQNMKVFAILFLLLTNLTVGYSQTLDESIKQVSDDLALKLSKKHLSRLALLDFTNEDGKRNAATAYIQEQVEMDLINASDLSIMDRKHVKELLKENRMVSDGLIDETIIKKAISFIKVDGWVVGEITNFDNKFKLKLKVINGNTSQMLAASISSMIDVTELNQIMQPKACNVCAGTGKIKTVSVCTTCKGTGGESCGHCGGSGTDAISAGLGGNATACSFCSGKGKINCATCKGTGKVIDYNVCNRCRGTGKQL